MVVTHKKNLRTGKPVWTAYGVPRVGVKRLARDIKVDVAVIGAGISGAMIAQELAAAGLEVAVLDRRGPMKGSTFATTALLQYEIDTPLIHLEARIGRAKAARAWRRAKLGLESMAAKIGILGIPCDFERKDSLYLSGNLLDAHGLAAEHKARARIGLPVGYLAAKTLQRDYGITRRAALLSVDNIAVNPLLLTAGFLRAAQSSGASIYAPASVEALAQEKHGLRLTTSGGPAVKARYAVFASGYEMPRYMRVKKHPIYSTWTIATRPQPGRLWPDATFIWEASDPYLYVRTTRDGRVICGGADEDFSDAAARDALIGKKRLVLQRKLKALFPKLDTEAEFSWTGSFGASTTGLPTIGRIPGFKNCFCAMAYGGNGIVFSRIAAEIIRTAIMGQKDPDADLFTAGD